MVWNFYLLSQKIRRDRQRKNFLKQGVQNMFSSAISGGIFLRHLAGSNSLYSNRTERSDAYGLRYGFRQPTSKIIKEESNARIHIHQLRPAAAVPQREHGSAGAGRVHLQCLRADARRSISVCSREMKFV